MKSHTSALVALVSTVCIGVFAGCAKGSTSLDPAETYLSATPADAGASTKDEDDEESVPLPPPSKGGEDSDADASADAGSDGGKPDSGKSDGGGTPAVVCTAPNTCNGAVDLGQVSGDLGAAEKTAQGHTSQWFTVRVTEDDNGVFALDLWMTATLTSPPGANFDLFLYVPSDDTRECSAISEQATSTSGSDSATVKFGESAPFANAGDDSRTVTVEVRHVSGTCDPSKQWSLKLAGNK